MKNLLYVCLLGFLVVKGSSSVHAQVRINEVGTNGVRFQGAQKWVELYNAGSDTVDVGLLLLCDFPQYPEIRSLSVLAGDTKIPGQGFLVISWPGLDANNLNDAEIGLYEARTFDFNDASKLLDYMQWGSGNQTRSQVAQGAGLWVASEFVPAPGEGLSMQYIDNGEAGAGNWAVGVPSPNGPNVLSTSIGQSKILPTAFELVGNFPNPFNPQTTVVYELNHPGRVTLSVYNVLGQKVTDLFVGDQLPGRYEWVWDGTAANGSSVSSGMYFYRLNLNGETGPSRVMTLLK